MKKALFITLTLVLSVSFCLIFYNKGKSYNKGKPEIDHVFFITIDTLRADHLGCYGYVRNTSPFIDSLAKKGVLFENAYSQSPSTCPSHASIFTGLYPSQHRVLANGYVLDDSYTTLAEILRENGLKTAAFASTDRHFHQSNIDQGFEFYEEPLDTEKTYGFKYRPARLTINNAIIWLDNFDPKNKLFLWIHVFDPHYPYHPPREYYKELGNDLKKDIFLQYVERFHIDTEVFNMKVLSSDYEQLSSKEKMYEYITNYDAEIKYVDNELRRFYDFVERKGLNKNSLWIITSDHGEALGQHHWLQHGALIYQEEIHVPLIFFSNQKFNSKRIKEVVENFNIFSTVLDFLQIKIVKELATEINSMSLFKKIWNAQENLEKKFAFSERVRKAKKDPIIKIYEERQKYAIQNKDFKYIYRSDSEDEFYDIREDPFEQNNLTNTTTYKYVEEKKAFQKNLSETLSKLEKYENVKTEMVDKKTIERLKSLGYLK